MEFLHGRLFYDAKVLHNLISKFVDERQMELMNSSATKVQALFRGTEPRINRATYSAVAEVLAQNNVGTK